MNRIQYILFSFLTLLLVATSCREDELVVPTEYDIIGDETPDSDIRGLYLVNEGNMGSNKCTLDYYDYRTGLYSRNFYSEKNPNVIKELGDVGNDIGIYGSKLYVVVNCSHKVEVLDARSGVRIGQVDIPNCRYVRFHRGKAYVSAYVGPVLIDPSAPKGAVFEVDTAALAVTRKVTVGYQPEEMEIVDDYMYVANSGGYRAPDYETKLSVIDAATMTVESEIEVAPNLQYVVVDSQRRLWISSRGDYRAIPGRLYCYDIEAHRIVKDIDVNVTSIWVDGDSIYTIGSAWNDNTQTYANTYGIIDTRRMEQMSDCFITDGTEQNMMHPAGVAVNPLTKEIFVTDARNYVNPGYLYCFTPEGTMKWRVRTGDIPSCIAFRGI